MRTRILVMTEGTVTEPAYVEGLQQHLRSRATTADVRAVKVGKDPLRVVERCIEHRGADRRKGTPYDHYVCLVDVDRHGTLERAIARAEQEGILLLISNLKFEVWLRWHASSRRSVLTSRQLDAELQALGLLAGKRLSPRFPFPSWEQAHRIAHQADPALTAGRMGPDPSTAMPVLVDLMRGEHPDA